MSICEIGERKKIKGKWYRKEKATHGFAGCDRCAFYSGDCPGLSISLSVENGGAECSGTIWVKDPARKPKPTKHAYRWNKRDGLIDADSHQVVQLVPNYCTKKRRDEIGKILADALNKGEA